MKDDPALRRERQEDQEFEAGLGYIMHLKFRLGSEQNKINENKAKQKNK